MIGEAPTRALELDAQQTGAHPLGESGDAATLESEEMLEGAARALGRFGKSPLLLADLLPRMTQPHRQCRDLAAPQAQPRRQREAEPLAAVVEQLRLGADERQRIGQPARQPSSRTRRSAKSRARPPLSRPAFAAVSALRSRRTGTAIR